MAKVLEKGLDSNFQDPDSGGEFPVKNNTFDWIHSSISSQWLYRGL